MDEKTEELREIFMDVSDEGTVTERQEESPGTLADDEGADDRLVEVIERMRERYEFRTALDSDDLRAVARGFYTGESDDEIASHLEIRPEVAFQARLDLHLLKESDRDAPFDFDAFRRAIADSETDPTTVVDDSDADIHHYRDVVSAEQAMRRANYRYRDQFDDILGDGDIAEHLTRDVTDDGLEDATEGIEINTAF